MNAPRTVLLAHLGRLLPVADDGQGVNLLHEIAHCSVGALVALDRIQAGELLANDHRLVMGFLAAAVHVAFVQHLQMLKAQEMERAGKAQREAQDLEKARLEAELVKKEKEIQNQKNAKSRSHMALAKEKRLVDEKKRLEEQVTQIERKKVVFQ